VIDYSEPGWTERVLEVTGGARPSVVFDGVGGELGLAAFAITAVGGCSPTNCRSLLIASTLWIGVPSS
jgi:NADPH:quinone reductase-like Zn-dependent oxidoreductase